MKYLQYQWKPRLFYVLAISILVSVMLVSLEWTSWAEQINSQGYTHGEGEGKMPSILMYILPFVKELILIGVPMLITVALAKLIGRFKKRK
ncbi:hypothetical protein GCM10009347_27410 [Shewanella algicola]|uniref:Uncharacterized protein n=1 Tax=Shewanella algicola TaxID=640633 RepID=A0A9X1ZGL9_9GAMM|nr:hypothetical protein [Shewanella algicola]MCL1106438.1 hypothetical protein [Shewanella algicola]GGP59435.1 hypothetical protein GCM10009347_27410 [Shewanella algicola]